MRIGPPFKTGFAIVVVAFFAAPSIARSEEGVAGSTEAVATPESTAPRETIATPLAVATAAPIATPELPKPWVAGWSSAILPGGGFFYLHQPVRGLAYFGVETVELGGLVGTLTTSGYDSRDPATNERLNRVLLPGVWLQDTHFTGIYDAYRAARVARHNLGYATPIPEPGLAGLMRAPFETRTLLRARVALPLTAVAAGGLAFSLWYRTHAPADSPSYWDVGRTRLLSREVPKGQALAAGEAYYATSFYAVGIGEEALFRGVLQTTFEEWWGTTPGLLAGSAVFGLAHFANDPTHPLLAVGNVAFTAALGTYLGWMYVDDGYDLRAGVAFHVWYDFLVGSAYFLSDPRHQPLSAHVSIPF